MTTTNPHTTEESIFQMYTPAELEEMETRFANPDFTFTATWSYSGDWDYQNMGAFPLEGNNLKEIIINVVRWWEKDRNFGQFSFCDDSIIEVEADVNSLRDSITATVEFETSGVDERFAEYYGLQPTENATPSFSPRVATYVTITGLRNMLHHVETD